MTLHPRLNRTSSLLPLRTAFRRIASKAFCFAGLAVLALASCTVMPLVAQTAHAGGTLPVGSGFNGATGVSVDASGDVFVADYGAGEVKEIVAVGGVVSAGSTVNVLGSGFSTPFGVAVDGSGDVFVADVLNNQVKEIVAVGGAVSASSTVNIVGSGFAYPYGVAVDRSGNVFVADYGHNAVKEVVAVGGVVSASSTVNTVGSGFSRPYSVAVDGNGNVFVADSGHNAVKEVVAVGGVVSASSAVNTVGSGFNNPLGVAVDPSGNVFVADTGTSTVKEIVAVGGMVSASSSVINVGSGFSSPTGVAVDGSRNIFVADFGSASADEIVRTPRKFAATAVAGTSTAVSVPFTFDGAGSIGAPVVLTQGATGLDFADAGTGSCTTNGTGYSYNAGDTCTVDVTFTPKVPGQRLGAVQLTTTGGAVIATADIYGTGLGPVVTFPDNNAVNMIGSGFGSPDGVAVDGKGDVFVADTADSAVKEIVAVGGVVSASSSVINVGSGFISPFGIAVDGSGDVFVTDNGDLEVKEIVATDGAVSSSSPVIPVGSGFGDPYGVAVDGSGNVFVADHANDAVDEVLAEDGIVSASSTVIPIGGNFSGPWGIAVDGSGNVFVAEYANNAVEEVVAVDGAVSSTSTVKMIGGGFSSPVGVAVDASGDVFVGDSGNHAVKKIVAAGGIVSTGSTVVTLGSGFGFTLGVAVDGRGNVFVGEPVGVNEIDLSDPPSLSFPTTTNVGATDMNDGAKTVTVANSGNAALTFPVPASGANPSISAGFTLDSSSSGTCPLTTSTPSTLAAGAVCTLPVSFAPTAAGVIAGSLVLTDTDLNANPAATQTISLNGVGQLIVPTLAFTAIPDHTLGDAPFTVTATSASSGAVTYSVTSGPATIAGDTVTLTGTGMVTLAASQAPTATYAAATASASFTVGAAPVLDFSMTTPPAQSASIAPGGAATFHFSVAPTAGAYPGTVSFAATGLPAGATATFSPSSIAANGGAQTVTLTVQTSAVAELNPPMSTGGGMMAFALLFLPLAGTRRLRRVARKIGGRASLVLLLLLSLGAIAGLSGCGGGSTPSSPSNQAQSYTIAVTVTSGSAQHTGDFTLQVQ